MKSLFSTRIKHIVLLFSFWTSLIGAFLIHVYTLYPFLIEYFYSREIFLKISLFQRQAFGKYSFNFGDFFFIILFLSCLYFIVKFALLIWYRKYDLVLNMRSVFFIGTIFFSNYILFTLLWGMNFKREPVTRTLKLDTVLTYTPKHLAYLSRILVDDINACIPVTELQKDKFLDFKAMVHQTQSDINTVSFNVFDNFDTIHYEYPSVKKSMIVFFMNRMGIAGYHNPFTGEAIINSSIPNFLKPAAMIHEIMHQMGFARESEAAFISFVFAKKNHKDIVSYSVFLDLFLTINKTLFLVDPSAAKLFVKDLHPMAQEHLLEFQDYIQKNKSSVEILSDETYNFFININSKSETTKHQELLLLMLGYQSKIDKTKYQLLTSE